MKAQFRALPLARGESYLLKSRRGSYLVDGGPHVEGGLSDYLRTRDVRKLRAGICTHFDRDHVNGLLGLLWTKYPMTEFWVPDSLDMATALAAGFVNARSAVGDVAALLLSGGADKSPLPEMLGAVRRSEHAWRDRLRLLQGASVLCGLAVKLLGASISRHSWNDLEHSWLALLEAPVVHGAEYTRAWFSAVHAFVSEAVIALGGGVGGWGFEQFPIGGDEDAALATWMCRRCAWLIAMRAEGVPASSSRNALEKISILMECSAAVVYSGVSLRFFRYSGQVEERLVPRHPMCCVNSHEVLSLRDMEKVSPASLAFMLENRIGVDARARVFRYGEESCSVLFCSDSDFSFIRRGEGYVLDRASVITAPNHGSVSGVRAYDSIRTYDDADLWIRSMPSRASKIVPEFLEKRNKTCVSCGDRGVREIFALFEPEQDRWELQGLEICTGDDCPFMG